MFEKEKKGVIALENKKQFIIVTGMSGAGKTMTLKVLEDFGFITI